MGLIQHAIPAPAFIALSDLHRELVDGDRHYFDYRMQVQNGEVALEDFYDADHPFNLDDQLNAIGTAPDVDNAAFGPYQQPRLRLIEIPNYNTSESFDVPAYVVAHETGHQCWRQRVVPAPRFAFRLIAETMAQYSALLTIERLYRPAAVRTLLRKELDRYLHSRRGAGRPAAAHLGPVDCVTLWTTAPSHGRERERRRPHYVETKRGPNEGYCPWHARVEPDKVGQVEPRRGARRPSPAPRRRSNS